MKYTLISSALLAAVMFSGAANATFGGTIQFQGQLVNAACAVDLNSTNQTIQMGQFRTASFGAAGAVVPGATTPSVPFSIQLNDCDVTAVSSAQVSFLGQADTTGNLTNVLAIGNGAGDARGVGIRITDSAGVAAPLDLTPTSAVTLSQGKNVLPFSAQYVATRATVEPGTANAGVTFHVTYQ